MGFINNIDRQYQALLQDILDNGVEKKDRTGTGTISVFGRQIRHNMKDGFPLLTTKKMPFKTIVTELLWFLRGDTNIKYLVDNGCNIWNGDAYKNYVSKVEKYTSTLNVPDDISEFQEVMDLVGDQMMSSVLTQEEFINKIKTDGEFAKKWGELGPIYGKQWRSWGERKHDSISNEYFIGIDQIQNLINDLKTNPDSRRLMVNAWNVGELDQMVLPPCHYGFQVYTRELSFDEFWDRLTPKQRGTMEKPYEGETYNGIDSRIEFKNIASEVHNLPTRAISLMYNARSQDVPLGTPFNISSYALLLVIIGKMVNMVPDELITNMGDCHIYLNQIDGVREQITREPFELPKLVMSNQINFSESVDEFLNSCLITDFIVENYQSHPTIKMPLSN
jgi:thymidylate synthase